MFYLSYDLRIDNKWNLYFLKQTLIAINYFLFTIMVGEIQKLVHLYFLCSYLVFGPHLYSHSAITPEFVRYLLGCRAFELALPQIG